MARAESTGPAERAIAQMVSFSDHLFHHRLGIVRPVGGGVKWSPVRLRDGAVHAVAGRNRVGARLGELGADGTVTDGGRPVGRFMKPGVFAEAATAAYRAALSVWEADAELAARWASWALKNQPSRDLVTVLAALMVVQDRFGEPLHVDGETVLDDDYRAVGEAILLSPDVRPQMLVNVYQVLTVPEIARLNRERGFGKSARRSPLGCWPKVVTKWLRYREANVELLNGLVSAGQKTLVRRLASLVGYKPRSADFFKRLGWSQRQSAAGHRTLAIGEDVDRAPDWTGLDEVGVCRTILRERPSWLRLVGMVPATVGVTRAVIAAAVEAGSISPRTLVTITPQLEATGALEIPEVRAAWEKAVASADDLRAANVARNVRAASTREKLRDGADAAARRAVATTTRDMRLYVFVDKSGSMDTAMDVAKEVLGGLVPTFPLERCHVLVFDTDARVVPINAPKRAAVERAFRGIGAGGGTIHRSALIRAFKEKLLPRDDEDVVMVWIGDQGEYGEFSETVRECGLRPDGFILIELRGQNGTCVQDTARALGIPCARVDASLFRVGTGADPYALPQRLRAALAAVPAQRIESRRSSVLDAILAHPLLTPPAWSCRGVTT